MIRAVRAASARRAGIGAAVLATSLLIPLTVRAQTVPDARASTVAAPPAAATAPVAAMASTGLSGHVVSGGTPLVNYAVTLYVTNGSAGPSVLGTAVTGAAGAFALDPTSQVPPDGVAYLVVESPSDAPLENAAGMARNLADPSTGDVGAVLATAPNGGETTTLETFHSLANMVAACVASAAACDALFTAATTPEGQEPDTTFRALVSVAHDPWHSVGELFAVSLLGPAPYQPARVVPPPAWTLALRFDGDGMSLDGPGNFAIDHEGFLWVNNNYEYDPTILDPVCGSDEVFKFTPTGQFVAGSPFTGGGLSGAGFGIDIDPFGDVWVGNYGFASPPPGCPAQDQPPHNSISEFRPDGTPVSPSTGYTAGGLDWPQATVADEDGNIWVASCGSGTVTLYPDGDPSRARRIDDLGLTEAFGIAFNPDGVAFVTGIGSSTVAMIGPGGTPLPGSPISGPFLDRPMGIATDSTGNLWIANSGFVDLPCPDVQLANGDQGSVALLAPDGTPRSDTAFQAGGVTLPWGIAVDGNDNVWVANFAGKRVSQLCGVPTIDCRPGTTTGASISPDVTGYGFDGLVRNTGVAIDPSGNVWLTNNWKEIPDIEGNPGGYEIVAFVGLAGPVQPPAPRPRPIPLRPRFTG